MFKYFLPLITLVTLTYADIHDDCSLAIKYSKAKKIHEKEGMPPLWLRQNILACTGITRYLKGLDALDRDLLLMRARHYIRQSFDNSMTETESPKKYSQFIPKKNIDNLFELLNIIYPNQQRIE